ncbi:iron ABC transporter permease [Heliorestis acidaminivorans]|uniref:Iron ABC transporter permease n=1 Tax=Heliorestis acidaminivorans TaxID=553427 RepID=A0A6I0EU39_9FIRM|nr:iron ABC transporter permease [Heliorestis acidaminivorans]KAB2951167.1 iron ABC transporter permease [Heliorestis acidaminivorans]
MNKAPIEMMKEVNTKQEQARYTRAFSGFWLNLWKGNPPGTFLLLVSLLTGLAMLVPLSYVFIRGIQGGVDRWLNLLDTRIPILLYNTLSLTIVVTFFAIVIGLSLAWLVIRTDLPGRKTWQWLLALPLLIPPYVGAITYIIIFGPRGWVRDWLGAPLFNIYDFWGVVFVLTMFTYPYVYLITSAALKRYNLNYEEAARAAGLSYRHVFIKAVFPLLRPAIGAGAILVALYVLSDFGLVAMMRYTTFTAAIYYQMGNYDQVAAAILSVVLILITLLFIWAEAKTREKQRFYQSKGTPRQAPLIELGWWKGPLLAYASIIFGLAVFVPLSVLAYWASVGLTEGVIDQRFWGFAWNSFYMAGMASLICMFLALPVVYMKSRNPSIVSTVVDKLAYAGYALPGVIVALGIIFLFNQYIPFLYGTAALVITAYVIRFLPQNMQAADAALSQVSPRLDEAARISGFRPWQVIVKVILPLVTPGLLAGGALVFVSAMKELPATLLLRPPGMDTLAVRIWVDASEGFYQTAAPAALLLILLSIIPLRWMLSKY